MLWVYNRAKEKIHKSMPRDICFKDYIYETKWKEADERLGKYVSINYIEDIFANQEKEYSDVLKRIIKICESPSNKNALICNAEEKLVIARFIANMLLRNPWSLNQFMEESHSNKVQNNEKIGQFKEIMNQLGFGGFDSLYEMSIKK